MMELWGVNFGVRQAAFLAFLISAAWQDIRRRSISVWIYLAFGGIASGVYLFAREIPGFETVAAVMIGLMLLLLSKWSAGAIGEGDGWFFVVTGIYLTFWENLALLIYGLLLSSSYCFGIIIWGKIYNVNINDFRIPFLPFLLPAGLWIVLWQR